MRVVLTGATGLIGSHLLPRLAERGHSIVALVRDVERARREAPGAAEYVKWSAGSSVEMLIGALEGADAVINLAGSPALRRWTERARRSIEESRIDGTRSIVEAMKMCEHPPAALINASAVGYYGAEPTGETDESSPPGKDYLADVCRRWEIEAVKAEQIGVRVVLLRTGLVLSTDGGALASLLPSFRLFVGGPIASGRQPFPWIHIEDEVEMILWALETPNVHGPLNAVAPGLVDYRTFARTLAGVLHRPSWFRVPGFALRLALGDAAMALIGGQWAPPRRPLELGYRFAHASLEPALRSLLAQ